MKKYKAGAALLMTLLLILLAAGPAASAGTWTGQPADGSGLNSWPSVAQVEARNYLVLDSTTGQVLLAYNADTAAYPASTTKIMTAILALEADILGKTATVSESAVKLLSSSSKVGFIAGEIVQMRDVIGGMMTVSGNDAANVVAEKLAGSQESFAALMNKKAIGLGMTGTNYVNAHGLHDENHYTTARDMAVLAAYAMKNKQFRELVTLERYSMPATNKHPYSGWGMFINTNKFLQFGEDTLKSSLIDEYTGIKTGTTTPAGSCLVSAAKLKSGHELIAVVFGVTNKTTGNVYIYSRTLLNAAAEILAAGGPTAAETTSAATSTDAATSAAPVETTAVSTSLSTEMTIQPTTAITQSESATSGEPTESGSAAGFFSWQNPLGPTFMIIVTLAALLAALNILYFRSHRRRRAGQSR